MLLFYLECKIVQVSEDLRLTVFDRAISVKLTGKVLECCGVLCVSCGALLTLGRISIAHQLQQQNFWRGRTLTLAPDVGQSDLSCDSNFCSRRFYLASDTTAQYESVINCVGSKYTYVHAL